MFLEISHNISGKTKYKKKSHNVERVMTLQFKKNAIIYYKTRLRFSI